VEAARAARAAGRPRGGGVKGKDRRRLDVLGRIGFIARAITYSMIGLLAAQASFMRVRPELDRTGAMSVIAAQPYGPFILMGLAAGFIGFAVWRGGMALFPSHPTSIWKRIAYTGSALFHAGLAVIALFFLAGTRGEDRWDGADLTAFALELPLGRWIIAAIGAGLLCDVGWAAHRAVTLRFRKNLDVKEMPDGAEEVAAVTGVAGLVVRGLIHLLMGIFLLRAAWLRDPDQTVGFNEALRLMGRVPWGGFVMALLALGLLSRGVYDVLEARYRKRS
jgi:hypothetical protein